MKLGRYLLFSGEYFYPNGGWNDFRLHAETTLSLTNFITELTEKGLMEGQWWHIYDTEKFEIILKSDNQPTWS